MRKVISINQNWNFKKGDTDQWENIHLPHTWNGEDGQDGGNDYFRGACVYKKVLEKSDLPEAECYFLEINGANNSASVVVNGKELAKHDNGYSTWRVNLTDALQESNIIEITVDNAPTELVYPQTADFTFYGGLYRDVNIIAVAKTHFDLSYFGGKGFMVTPVMEDHDAKVTMNMYVVNLQPEDKLFCHVKDYEGNEIEIQEVTGTECEFILKNAHLWNGVKDPYLYTAEASIVRQGEVIDSVTTRFGCRSFEINAQNGFILNGKEYPLHGVSRHQDRLHIGNALLPEHHKEDMDLICELGANTIRLAHYQHAQYFYDLCDERGIVVWAEIPYISCHMPEADDNTVLQMKELIIQNYNHPSIVVWGISNEITMDGAKNKDMIRQHRILNDLVHEMDKTRKTVVACLSTCNMDEEYVHISDVVAYNHYFGWYGGDVAENGPWFDKFHEKYPNTPIAISEYGCEALDWHTSTPKQGDYTEEYQAYYHEEMIKQLFSRKYIWATYVWNMFDFGADARAEGGENGQNHKGLITMDRTYKKDSFYAYKAWLSDDPFVHICSKRYINRVEDTTKVTVYSNLPEVELFVNGISAGKQTAEDHFFRFEVVNQGESSLLAVAGKYQDKAKICKVETPDEKYMLKEKGAVLNWFDVKEMEGKFSLNDKIGDITQTLRGKIWMMRLLLILAKKQKGGNTSQKKKKLSGGGMDSGIMKMLSGFTVLRFTSMLGMRNISFTKEELLKLNKQLNKISKKN